MRWVIPVLLFVVLELQAAVPQLSDFNTTQFGTVGGIVTIKNGANVTNLVGVSAATATNKTALEAMSVTDGTMVVLNGYYTAGDMPSALYRFAAGDTSTVDNGSVVTNAAGRFKLQPQGGRVDIRTFGAIADYSGEVDAVWTNTTTGLTLAAPLSRDYTGKVLAVRRGNTSVDASLYPLVDVGGIVTNWVIVNPGQGYIKVPTLTKTSGPGSGGTFTINLTAGQVSSVTIGAGGTLYTTNTSIFSVVSTDLGLTTNAPYMSEQFTVNVQSGTAITLSGTPSFAMPLNPNDNLGKAIFYTDNATAIQNALNYATNVGAEVVIPAGNFATGPVYLNEGQKLVGLDKGKSKLYFTQGNIFTTYRRSVLTANDINFSNGRQAYDGTLKDVYISGFTIDGNAQWQNPMGANLANGSFALMGINCLAGERWTIERMTITNCQGDGLYLGSFSPTTGSSGDFSLVRSTDIYVRDVLIAWNWRNGSQMGNVQNSKWENFRFKDDSVGIWEVVTRRGNAKGTYSDEEIDMEANSGAVSGFNHFSHGEVSAEYGEAFNQLYDQRYTYIDDVTFRNCKSHYFAQSGSISTVDAVNQESLGEHTTLNNCKFIATATNYTVGSFVYLRHRGTRIQGCQFEGSGSVTIDYSIGNTPEAYQPIGITFTHNLFNLYPLPGATSAGLISTFTDSTHEIHRLMWDDSNVILSGITDIRGPTRQSEATAARLGGNFAPEGYIYQPAAGSSANLQSEFSTAGLGSQDFTVSLRATASGSAAANNGIWFRLGTGSFTELELDNRIGVTGKTFDLVFNPSNVVSSTIIITNDAPHNSFGALSFQTRTRPFNATWTRKIGSVYSITIVDGGTNYITAPTIGLTGFGGSGATAGALVESVTGIITNIYVLNPGTGFTTNFQVTITSATGSNAVAIASVGRMKFYIDDELAMIDSRTNVAMPFTTAPVTIKLLQNAGNYTNQVYSYAVWNRALSEAEVRRYLINGVEPADKWGTWGSTAGCLTQVKLDTGIGWFFPDASPNNMHVWSGADLTHGVSKNSGQIRKRLAITTATGGTNSFNLVTATRQVIPAFARITSAYVIPQSGAAPTVRLGFDSAITDQLVAPVTLTASTTNYLSLVPAMVYGTTNRPVYLGQTGAATNEVVINYSLDQGGLDGSAIQSGIVMAPGGLGSTSAIAATAIDATGWTNTFGVNAMVYAEGTGLQYTVYNAGGTAVYTNAATVGSASIALQKGGKVIVIAGTGVSGRAVPW